MIPVPPIHIFSAMIVCWFVFLTALWVAEVFRQRRTHDWTAVKERLYRCENCHISFLAINEKENSAHCPYCDELCYIRKQKHF